MADQTNPATIGLPVDKDGNLDPTGNYGAIPSGKMASLDMRAVPYGMAGTMFGDRKEQTNPLMSLPARTVIESAKKKLNEHLRAIGREVLGQDEDPPALLVLIELREYTQEPLKTDAFRALRHMPVYLATSQEIVAKWGRTPYKSVPYEVRQFPMHVANMLLNQIQSFLFIPVMDERRGIFVGRRVPPTSMIRVSHKRFRQPKAEEIQPDRLRRLGKASLTAVKGQESTGELHVDLDPEMGGDVIDVAGGKVNEFEQDGQTRQKYVSPPTTAQVSAGGPAQGSTSQPPKSFDNPETPQQQPVRQPASGIPPAADAGAR